MVAILFPYIVPSINWAVLIPCSVLMLAVVLGRFRTR
jgi:hypothetical protein